MLKSCPLLPRLSVVSFTRNYTRKMSTKPPLKCPKFIPLEGGDISSRSTTDRAPAKLYIHHNVPCCAPGYEKLITTISCQKVYVKSSLFPHSPPSCLKWKSRSEAVLTVLKNLGADFLCLQELDHDDFYKRIMETDGYSSIYIQRSGQKRDGCGIFYKQNRSELLLQERIEYNDLVNSIQDEVVSCDDEQSNMLAKGNEDAPKDGSSHQNDTSKNHGDLSDPCVRLKRDCVGIMAAFRLKSPFDHVIVVANTHLYWDPELADVKLAQAKYLLSRLAQFKTLVSHKFKCLPSVIVAGDFNSVPNDKVYQYLVSGYSSSAQQEEILEELPIPLCSVYAFTRGEPPFTNCTPDFTDTLDYIFFSPSDSIKPVSILELPKKDSPEVVGCLPNQYHPSDHLPIGAEFEITRE